MKRIINDQLSKSNAKGSYPPEITGRKRRRIGPLEEKKDEETVEESSPTEIDRIEKEPIPYEEAPVARRVTMEPRDKVEEDKTLANATASLTLRSQSKTLKQRATIRDHVLMNLYKPTLHRPTLPPTAQQAAERLRRRADRKPSRNNGSARTPPRAPPPSPFVVSPTATTTKTTTASRVSLSPEEEQTPTVVNPASSSSSTSSRPMKWLGMTTAIRFVMPVLVASAAFLLSTCSSNNSDGIIPNWFGLRFGSMMQDSALGVSAFQHWSSTTLHSRLFAHIVPPKHAVTTKGGPSQEEENFLTNVTLREFLTHPDGFHLAMAPAFFGFYAYFGVLAAWDDELLTSETNKSALEQHITSVSGGSAGAMAAILIAAGVPPRKAAAVCATLTLDKFADPPGLGAVFKGNLFEELVYDFLRKEKPDGTLQLEDAIMPVAVSGFDLRTLQGKILSRGSMARAARASATFPLLFQPVKWEEEGTKTSLLIDGGVTDGLGVQGLSVLSPDIPKRVVNIVVGDYFPGAGPRGPSAMPDGVMASEVVSISIRNTPRCGPWAMANGPRAVEASSRAMLASLDLPLYKGNEEGHYEFHIDATSFVPE